MKDLFGQPIDEEISLEDVKIETANTPRKQGFRISIELDDGTFLQSALCWDKRFMEPGRLDILEKSFVRATQELKAKYKEVGKERTIKNVFVETDKHFE